MAILQRWAAVDTKRTRTLGAEEGSLLGRRPVSLEGELKRVLLLCQLGLFWFRLRAGRGRLFCHFARLSLLCRCNVLPHQALAFI